LDDHSQPPKLTHILEEGPVASSTTLSSPQLPSQPHSTTKTKDDTETATMAMELKTTEENVSESDVDETITHDETITDETIKSCYEVVQRS